MGVKNIQGDLHISGDIITASGQNLKYTNLIRRTSFPVDALNLTTQFPFQFIVAVYNYEVGKPSYYEYFEEEITTKPSEAGVIFDKIYSFIDEIDWRTARLTITYTGTSYSVELDEWGDFLSFIIPSLDVDVEGFGTLISWNNDVFYKTPYRNELVLKTPLKMQGKNDDPTAQNSGVNWNDEPGSVVFGDSNTNNARSSIIGGSCNTNSNAGGFSIMAGCWNKNEGTDCYNSIITGHENTNTARGNIVAGRLNEANTRYSMLAGYKNTASSIFGSDGTSSYGEYNCIAGSENKTWGRANFVSGYGNTVKGNYLLVTGRNNTVGATDYSGWLTSNATYGGALVVGKGNVVTGHSSVTSGATNVNNYRYSNALGEGLQTYNNYHTVIGKFNAAGTGADIFSIGTGTSSTAKRTTFNIKSSGAVIIDTKSATCQIGDIDYGGCHGYSVTIGRGLKTDAQGQVVVGRYNDTSVMGGNTIFAIGNGTSDTARSTIFSIRENGTAYHHGKFAVDNEIHAYGGVRLGSAGGPVLSANGQTVTVNGTPFGSSMFTTKILDTDVMSLTGTPLPTGIDNHPLLILFSSANNETYSCVMYYSTREQACYGPSLGQHAYYGMNGQSTIGDIYPRITSSQLDIVDKDGVVLNIDLIIRASVQVYM